MVYRVIAHCHTGPVALKIVPVLHLVDSEQIFTLGAATLPVIWEECQFILRRILVICEAQILVAQFGLYEIQESESAELRLSDDRISLLAIHLDDISIEVISFGRPIYHYLAVLKLTIRKHHLRRPLPLVLLEISVERVDTAVYVVIDVVSFRLFDSHIGSRAVVL